MNYGQAQDLLNAMASDICPNLRLDFLSYRGDPCVQTGFIDVANTVSFDIVELSANNSSQIVKLFKLRVEKSLVDLRKKILEDLRELRKKGT